MIILYCHYYHYDHYYYMLLLLLQALFSLSDIRRKWYFFVSYWVHGTKDAKEEEAKEKELPLESMHKLINFAAQRVELMYVSCFLFYFFSP